jgi:hypothetical protein
MFYFRLIFYSNLTVKFVANTANRDFCLVMEDDWWCVEETV